MNKELEEAVEVTQKLLDLLDFWDYHGWIPKIHSQTIKKEKIGLETVLNYIENSIPKDKVKEILDKLSISDIEPWSTYKVDGEILFNLQELLERK